MDEYEAMMGKLVIVRHGESLWNLANRFTGWVDVDLSENGVAEAQKAGHLLAAKESYFMPPLRRYSNGPSGRCGSYWTKRI